MIDASLTGTVCLKTAGFKRSNRRFVLVCLVPVLSWGSVACAGPVPTPVPATKSASPTTEGANQTTLTAKQTPESPNSISIFDLPGIQPTDVPVPTPELVSEHAEDLPMPQLPPDIGPVTASSPPILSEADLDLLRTLWIGSLSAVPPDPSNAVADDPLAARLGQRLFFDRRLSANGRVACVTCHKPELMFTDGLPRAKGIGTTARNSMTIIGVAYSPWLFWDGRRDSLWSQATGPMEDRAEHGGTRTQYAHIIDEDPIYRAEYEMVFGSLPDFTDRARFPDKAGPLGDSNARAAWLEMTPADRETVTRVYANLGKAIAAYERLILPGPARFDTYVQAALAGDRETMQTTLTFFELEGLRLFTSGPCIKCHNGPLFTDYNFYNIEVPNPRDLPRDVGRINGVRAVLSNEFNCVGAYSDAGSDDCSKLSAVETDENLIRGAFKVPTLRNVAETAPYMHAGQFSALYDVLHHYNRLLNLNFSHEQYAQIEAFLRTLSGPLTVDPELLAPLN